MKKHLFALFLATLTLALAACNPAPPEPSPTPSEASPTPTEAPSSSAAPSPSSSPAAPGGAFPRLDGSTATIPLGEAVLATLLDIPREEAAQLIQFSGTNNSVYKLVYHEADLLIVYEPPADSMSGYGPFLEYAPIGRDALVFLINAQNTVTNLTTKQIQDIYTDKITDWAAVGGKPGEILAYQRNESSGSQTMMKKLVMPGLTMTAPPSDLVISEMEGLIESVASYDNGPRAIGYNVFYYVTRMKPNPNVALLSVDGVAPSNETIAAGDYPFVNDFFVMIRKDEPQDSVARQWFTWLQGADARALMEREGYTPIAQTDTPER